uniref:Ig-like domain-containing protein n=1 Tax=Amphiprion percula TaxID=161767 RepID=A0A3P8SMD7_AMPPE
MKLMKNLCLLFSGSSEDVLTPFKDVLMALEGDSVTLSCNYSVSVSNLYWYQQKSSSSPQLLMTAYSEKTEKLSVRHDAQSKELHLNISSAAVSDSAVYYCALRPTVTGNNKTLETHSVKALISVKIRDRAALKTQSLLNKMKSVEQKENLSHSHVTIRQSMMELDFTGTNITLTFRLLSLYSGKKQKDGQMNIFLIIDMDPKQQLHQLH